MADLHHPRQVIELLTGRWTLDVLAQLDDGGRRYHDLHESLDGIAHQVLTSTLRRAERDGLIARRVRDAEPPAARRTHLSFVRSRFHVAIHSQVDRRSAPTQTCSKLSP